MDRANHAKERTEGSHGNREGQSLANPSNAELCRLAAFAQFSPNPVFAVSLDGSLSYCNEAAQRVADSLNLKQPSELLPEETSRVVWQCITTGTSSQMIESRQNDHTFQWLFYAIPALREVFVYGIDASDRANRETQLRQMQKMEAIGQLAAGVAHDFNNILTIIQGYASRLHSKDHPAEWSHNVEQILDATERAASLTRQLLAFGQRQPVQRRLMDLRNVASRSTKVLDRLIGEKIRLSIRNPDHLPAVLADSGMVEQLLLNLVVNARDAMPEGGDLAIETFAVEINEAEAQARPLARAGRFVCLRVADTGCGMTAATRARIFEPFYTTKGLGEGTGLGLAAVYGIVQQHQGWIEVASEVGQGTSFAIYLPAVETSIPEPKPQIDASGPPPGGQETILVVEDEPMLREFVQTTLSRSGYTVFEAADGPSALEVWKKHGDKVDLLFTDLMMPGGMTGRQLGEQLLKLKPGLKVVYSSGYSSEISGSNFTEGKGRAFLQKPYRPAALLRLLRQCLDEH